MRDSRSERNKWTSAEYLYRVRFLQEKGFLPAEAFEIAEWYHPLTHKTIQLLITIRQERLRRYRQLGMGPEAIEADLQAQYEDLGIRGQYDEDERYP